MDPQSSFLGFGIVSIVVVVGGLFCVAAVVFPLLILMAAKRAGRSIDDAGARIQAFAAASGMVRVGDERVERAGPDGREHAQLSWFTKAKANRPILHTGISFEQPFAFGLRITRRTDGPRVFVALGVVHDVATGDPFLDGSFRIVASDAAGAAQLLASPDIRAALAAFPIGPWLEINDREAFIQEDGWNGLTPDHVEALLAMVRPVARAFSRLT